ncbi:Putative replication protein RepA [Mycobacteroides abscessus]|nr:Putative replication protein RepA [Mycobacteroides abscessus]
MRQTRPRRATARPLATQKLAAGLVALTHGLDRTHIGAICDALTGAGINPAVWSARAVNDALNADMHARGTTWPDHIANPGAFLASRLRRLSWTPPETTPTKAGGCAAASIDQTPHPVVLTDASRARITAAQEEIRRVLTERAQRSREEHTSRTPMASSRRGVGLPERTRAAARSTDPQQTTVRSAETRWSAPLNVLVDDAPSGCEPAH